MPPEREPRTRLRTDLIQSLAGNLIFALCQAGIILLVARLGQVEQVGYITLATAIVAPVFVIASLSLREAKPVDAAQAFSDAEYFALRCVGTVAAVVVVPVILMLAYRDAPTAMAAAALAFMAVRAVQSQAEHAYAHFQFAFRLDLMGLSNIARGVLGLAGFGLAFWATRNLGAAFLAQAFAWGVVGIAFDQTALTRIGARRSFHMLSEVQWSRVAKLLIWLAPLALAGVFLNLTIAIPRLVLAEHVTFAALGLFGGIAYFQTAATFFTQAMAQASTSRLAKHYRDGERATFLRTAGGILALNTFLALGLIIGAALFGNEVIGLLLGNAYVNYDLMMCVAAAIGLTFISSVFAFGVTSTGRFSLNLAATTVVLSATVVLSFWLIPAHGLIGAGLTLVGSSAMRLAVNAGAFAYAVSQAKNQKS